MNLPALPVLLAVDALSDSSPVTVGLAIGLGFVFLAYGEARMQISGLREWKSEATQQIKGLQTENATIKATASTQGQQITHLLSMMEEVRTDVKSLLRKSA